MAIDASGAHNNCTSEFRKSEQKAKATDMTEDLTKVGKKKPKKNTLQLYPTWMKTHSLKILQHVQWKIYKNKRNRLQSAVGYIIPIYYSVAISVILTTDFLLNANLDELHNLPFYLGEL